MCTGSFWPDTPSSTGGKVSTHPFAHEALAAVKTPMMVINSALDLYQTSCIFTSSSMYEGGCHHSDWAATWYECARNVSNCTTEQMNDLIRYERDFVDTVSRGRRNGRGPRRGDLAVHRRRGDECGRQQVKTQSHD